MRVKLVLPALTEAKSVFWRPIKYSLFPPLGLATLASHLGPDDEAELVDEHVEDLRLDDEPDLVLIQAYVTSARRSYDIADHYRSRGSFVALGGLHPTALPEEAARHADAVFTGPADATFPAFLADLRAGRPRGRYDAPAERTLRGLPVPRRDLLKRHRYLVPNSLVVSRGCPHRCDFCYKESFYRGGRSFYTRAVDEALAEIASLPGRHLYFLDDHLFGDPAFAAALFDGLRGMGRVFQGAATVASILKDGERLLDKAATAGLRSLFVGFESVSGAGLAALRKAHNRRADYEAAAALLHGRGVMINASFVFGLDDDGPEVFGRTVDWAVAHAMATATFHILTPYPGTPLFARLRDEGRITTTDWDLYDTRHSVFRPRGMSGLELVAGYRRAYRDFYAWSAIARSALGQATLRRRLRQLAYTAGWKKLEPLWNFVIKHEQLGRMLPVLEAVLDGTGSAPPTTATSSTRWARSCCSTARPSRWSAPHTAPAARPAP